MNGCMNESSDRYEQEGPLSYVTLQHLWGELLNPPFPPFPLPVASMPVVLWVLDSTNHLGCCDAESMRFRAQTEIICLLL